jgi:hypothetical protein
MSQQEDRDSGIFKQTDLEAANTLLLFLADAGVCLPADTSSNQYQQIIYNQAVVSLKSMLEDNPATGGKTK